MIDLPSEWEQFYDDMKSTALKYIKIGFWQIKEDDFILWLNNFKKDSEKFLAALMIYRFIYRNRDSMVSMYQYVVDLILPVELSELAGFEIDSLDDYHNRLVRGAEVPFRFSAIEGVDNQTGKSGSAILREFARSGPFHNKLKISPTKLKDLNRNQCKLVVFFDDIMGTGEQFNKFLETFYADAKGLKLLYCPLAATTKALDSFDYEMYPDVRIRPVEILDKKYNFFDKALMPMIAEDIDIEELKKTYDHLIKRNTKLKKDLYGRGDLSLTYIFSVSTPNNVLPLFYYESESWNKLVPR